MLKLALGGAEHLSGRILWRLERAAMSHCCDVLGFSERVFRDALSGLHTYIQTVIDAIRPFQGIRVILFSDTVVIYTLEDTEDSFQEIVTITSRLLYSLLMAGVPFAARFLTAALSGQNTTNTARSSPAVQSLMRIITNRGFNGSE
jgi:hypothetical protein